MTGSMATARSTGSARKATPSSRPRIGFGGNGDWVAGDRTGKGAQDGPADTDGRPTYLIRKSSFFSLVPFISSRIQTGVMPRPDHFSDLSFLD